MGPSLMDTLWFEFWKTKILIALLFKTGWEDSPPLLCSWIKWWWSRELASLINIGFKNENLATSSRHLLYFPGGLIIIDHNQLCGGMDGTHCGSITKWIPISPKPSYLSQQQSNSDQSLGIYDLISADVGHMTHNVTLLIIKSPFEFSSKILFLI